MLLEMYLVLLDAAQSQGGMLLNTTRYQQDIPSDLIVLDQSISQPAARGYSESTFHWRK